MRLILLSATLALITACNQKSSTTANAPVTDVVQENLKGPVKVVKTETYKVDSLTGNMGALDSKSEENFDDKGYTQTYTSADGKDSVTTKSTFDHNGNGYTTQMNTTANGKQKSSLKIDVDNDGKISGVKSFDSTGKMDVYYTDITLNKFWQVTSAKGHHPDSTLKMSFTNNFDSAYFTASESKDSVGKLTYSNTATLNDKRDIVKQVEISVTKGVTKNTVTTYTYDAWDKQGNWTQQTAYNDKGKKIKIAKRTIEYR